MDTKNQEELWLEFEKTGSIYSYLQYKNQTNDNNADKEIKDGEPVGYC